MDNIREKLVELICKGTVYDRYLDRFRPRGCHGYTADVLADYLIDNGVTVQQWIPVTERLPKDGQCVLTYKNGICDVQTYEARRNGWVSESWFWSMATVTHWMPLPTPPKQER